MSTFSSPVLALAKIQMHVFSRWKAQSKLTLGGHEFDDGYAGFGDDGNFGGYMG